MQQLTDYRDLIGEIKAFFATQITAALAVGVERSQLILDPGIGFGKTHEHNLELIRNAGVFHLLRRPILVGHSRKGFIAKLLGSKDVDRKYGTLGVSLALCAQGIQILRVHDVAAHVQAIQLFVESRGE
jgi:dihydropteroate synthase